VCVCVCTFRGREEANIRTRILIPLLHKHRRHIRKNTDAVNRRCRSPRLESRLRQPVKLARLQPSRFIFTPKPRGTAQGSQRRRGSIRRDRGLFSQRQYLAPGAQRLLAAAQMDSKTSFESLNYRLLRVLRDA